MVKKISDEFELKDEGVKKVSDMEKESLPQDMQVMHAGLNKNLSTVGKTLFQLYKDGVISTSEYVSHFLRNEGYYRC